MDESVEVLRAIYSRPNELLVDEQAETITYNAFDDQDDSIGFSVIVFKNLSIIVDSQQLTNEQLKQLRAQASLTSTLYDLFTGLKSFYEELMKKRREETVKAEEDSSTVLIKIDHMRSPTIYMKHLRQWTQECQITGRVLVIPRDIFLLIEGTQENLKVGPIDRSDPPLVCPFQRFVVKFKTETVDIDSRGRPCKERLSTQIIQLSPHPAR